MPEQAEPVEVTQKRFRCRHVHAAGHQCGSPALRHEQFCYYHHTNRRPAPAPGKHRYIDKTEPFLLPIIEDRVSALAVASLLLSRLASNDLDIDRAAKMLYNLQLITALLPPEPGPAASKLISQPNQKPALIEELVFDDTHGSIAPVANFVPDPEARSSPGLIAPDDVSREMRPSPTNCGISNSSDGTHEPEDRNPQSTVLPTLNAAQYPPGRYKQGKSTIPKPTANAVLLWDAANQRCQDRRPASNTSDQVPRARLRASCAMNQIKSVILTRFWVRISVVRWSPNLMSAFGKTFPTRNTN